MNIINKVLHSELKKLHLEFGLKHTFIFLLSLSLNWFLFKLQSIALISGLITTMYFMIPNRKITIHGIPKLTYIYLNLILVTFLGSLATYNMSLSLIINLIVPFIIVCIFTNEANINGFSFYYMMFIQMQFFNITLDLFGLYLLSTSISLAIGYLFEEIIWSNNPPIDLEIISLKELIISRFKSNYLILKNSLDLDLFIPRFAIRLSIATTISITLWKYMNIPKWYWISMATCYTLVPMCNQINSRAFCRIKSNIIGSALFLIFSFIASNLYIRFAFILISALLMLSYIPYKNMSRYYTLATYISLSFSVFSLSSLTASTYRVIYVLIGSLFALIFNAFIFPNKLKVLSFNNEM